MKGVIEAGDFAFLRDLVMREAAIVLEPGKEYLASTRLEPVARKEGLEDVAALVRALRAQPRGKLHQAVIDAMTTNETLWFRDAHPFETLKQSVLPELIEKRAAKKSLNIWCSAASTGQEPYTLAMILRDNFPNLLNWKIRIVATDISNAALDRARSGLYTQMEMGRGLPASYMVKYFTRAGVDYQISQEIRAKVDFKVLNLAGMWPYLGTFDLVLIRNVLIYFNQETKGEIVNKAAKILEPDGYLMLGSTESLLNIKTNLERVMHDKTSCYRPKAG